MDAPAVGAPTQQTGWRGWWSRLRGAPAASPVRAPAATFDPDLPIETSRRVGPELDIWPNRSRGPLSGLLSTGMAPKADDGLALGGARPTHKMTAAEANRAIASLARPRKTDDDFVLPVRMWDDGDKPTLSPTPTFEDEQSPSALPEPILSPGPLTKPFSTQTKLDPDARNTSGAEGRVEVDPAEDAGPPPLAEQDPALDLVSVAQTPPPPPVRPSPRASQTPPAPAIEATPPAAPPAAQPAEPAESGDEAPSPATSDEHTPEAPSASLPAEPSSEATAAVAPPPEATAAVAPSVPTPTVQGPTPFVAAPQTGWASSQTLVAARPSDVSAPRRWSLLKWFRPQQTESRHVHHPGVFPSPQGPVELPPVLVPTSYYASLAPSGPLPSQQHVTPTAQQAFVMPSPQGPSVASQPKKPCFLVTRFHHRLDQFRQWKHAHVCKHIQSLKDMLAGKGPCHECGGAGAGPLPSAQALPSPQARPTAPTPQAQPQSWSPFRLGSTR